MILENVLEIDLTELLFQPSNRKDLFIEILNGIAERKPELNPEFAKLTKAGSSEIDFFIINSFISKETQTRAYAIGSYIIFSNKCIAAYDYCKKNNLVDQYFQELFRNSVIIPEKSFNSVIEKMLKLSIDKDSENYWKKKEFSQTVLTKLSAAFVKTTDRPQ